MESIAAIDVGSNAIRLVIGALDNHGDIQILKKLREPVRLGEDVFADGVISSKTRQKAFAAFGKFRSLLKENGVHRYKAVATSALREAKDREAFVQEVRKHTGIRVDVIDGVEEGRLIFAAVSDRIDLDDKVALLMDIGGGSVELTVVDHGALKATQTFKLGAVRLLQLMEERGLKEKNIREIIIENARPVREFLHQHLKGLHVDLAVGTGGNFECLGKLRVALLSKNSIYSMSRVELGQLVTHLQTMSVKERIQFLRLREDRADVIVPAALAAQVVMEMVPVDVLAIPYVGLREGILTQLGSKRLRVAK
jgi:exopolyphosphatase/guanosine-5'-triphosphate,3'-diphosphate pyrophosphatase